MKNLRKNGRCYWVCSHIPPITVEGEVVGYTAAKRPASVTEVEEVIPVYKDLIDKKVNIRGVVSNHVLYIK